MTRAFKIKKKALFITFNGISLKQIKKPLLEGESPNLRYRNIPGRSYTVVEI